MTTKKTKPADEDTKVRKYPKMNKRIKAKWLKALRSGEYKQGREALKNVVSRGVYNGATSRKLKKPTFCCLGVLCDLFSGKHDKWVEKDEDMFFEFKGARHFERLPHTLQKKVKLDEGAMEDLIELNDSKKASFKKIADFIEANL